MIFDAKIYNIVYMRKKSLIIICFSYILCE
uniref:Uncharacterized protein n=1 Tax=Siphoviridae sp. ctlHU7 TaxID=2827588 RepID=A0A8S5LIC3_9CAUD|nr:MAG TPA: hypothetical protein [Siphoviridae sp. ctlHU7]DAH08313.1 MAG TPA: hypothetical protein [Caudoviricetes sp.]DAL04404.1 MAG TPA: hypothetical protein [Caudoviricetes sp.]DAR80083.1 MAG TPA: hypothetical protein [Caudoviricetes sp.]